MAGLNEISFKKRTQNSYQGETIKLNEEKTLKQVILVPPLSKKKKQTGNKLS